MPKERGAWYRCLVCVRRAGTVRTHHFEGGRPMPRRVRTLGWILFALALVAAPLVVTAAPASATDVSDEASLRTAFGNASETTIVLTADISLTNCGTGAVTRNSATALSVFGNGHTVTQTCAGKNTFQQTGSGNLSFDDLHIAMAAGADGIDAGSGTVNLTTSLISNVANGDGLDRGGLVTLL